MRYIRHALPSDVPQLAVVEETCFPTAEEASAEQFAARVSAYGSHFWLLFDKHDRLLSFVDGLMTDKPVFLMIMKLRRSLRIQQL